ncbi:MAG: YceI family protein [Erythrobacter sp.]|nr:YceI family protein [Erythrobacter sp.]
MILPIRTLAIPALLALAACAQAPDAPPPLTEGTWSVDPAGSSLSYVTIKAGEIAEANSFTGLSGSVSPEGAARIEIDLSTVETKVDIRNERMRDLFFEVANHPTASITAQIDPAAFGALEVGESTVQPLAAVLDLKGVEAPLEADVRVTRTAENRVIATTIEPVILDAGALELTDKLAQLQEIAGLPSISPAVPVTFSIAFQR